MLLAGPCDQHGIRSAESEGIAQGRPNPTWPRLPRHVVKVALRVGLLQVHGRRQYLVPDRKQYGDQFQRRAPMTDFVELIGMLAARSPKTCLIA